MTVNNNLSKIISLVTSKGFQIHPEALNLIGGFQEDFFKIMEDILKEKKEKKEKKEESMVIISDDIRNFVKPSSHKIPKEENNDNNGRGRLMASRTS